MTTGAATPHTLPRYDLTLDEICEMLSVDESTVRLWVRAGKFVKPLIVSRTWRWNREAVLAWLEAQKEAPV
jgi:excisionase family DNA binding protein